MAVKKTPFVAKNGLVVKGSATFNETMLAAAGISATFVDGTFSGALADSTGGYATLHANSAHWNINTSTVYSTLTANSALWDNEWAVLNSVHSTLTGTSAQWDNEWESLHSVFSTVTGASALWDNEWVNLSTVYSLVSANSATWDRGGRGDSAFTAVSAGSG